MKELKLHNSNQVALVDDEDYDHVSTFRWLLSPKGYAIRYYGGANDRHQRGLHNDILATPSNGGVDHINRNKLDNQKANLRITTQSVNCQNKAPTIRNKTGYKGVSFDSSRRSSKHYKATICQNGRNITLGYFETAKKAATAYDLKAVELYGKDALTNEKLGLEVLY